MTGVTQTNAEVAPKLLQLLHEVLPAVRVVGLLVNPTDPALADAQTNDFLAAAQTLGVELHILNASTESDFDVAFATLRQLGAGALVISTDPFFTSHSEQLAALAGRNMMPAAYKGREFAATGVCWGCGGQTKWRHNRMHHSPSSCAYRERASPTKCARSIGGECLARRQVNSALKRSLVSEITDWHKTLVDEALWLRGRIVASYSQVEFLLADISVKLDLRFPYLIRDRIKAVRRIGDRPGYKEYETALNRICDDLLRFDEIRVFMAHGFMRLDSDRQGNHRFELLRYEREGDGKFRLLSAKTDIIRLREAAEHITEYVTNVVQLFERIYREKKLEPLNMDARPK